jgi:hypothetical protein
LAQVAEQVGKWAWRGAGGGWHDFGNWAWSAQASEVGNSCVGALRCVLVLSKSNRGHGAVGTGSLGCGRVSWRACVRSVGGRRGRLVQRRRVLNTPGARVAGPDHSELGRTARSRAQIKPFAIIQSFFQLVQILQVKNYKTQPSCSPKFFKLGMKIDKFKLPNFPFWSNSKISLDFEL